MNVLDAIARRRSIKEFAPRPIGRDELEPLLDAATLAPNHRMTQPWRFYVLGPTARRAYGVALGGRKAKKVEDPDAAQLVIERVAAGHEALPAMIAFAITQDDNPEIREEDYAAAMMAVQNFSLAAVAAGLGTHIKSGAVMDDPAARAAVGVAENERIVSIVNVGEPLSVPAPKDRSAASELTIWTD